jgi:hypothetical protein
MPGFMPGIHVYGVFERSMASASPEDGIRFAREENA